MGESFAARVKVRGGGNNYSPTVKIIEFVEGNYCTVQIMVETKLLPVKDTIILIFLILAHIEKNRFHGGFLY